MTEKELFEDVINHWERMLTYAKKQHPKGMPLRHVMEKDIGENWTGNYCAFCNAYWKPNGCKKCPVDKHDLNCSKLDSLWSKANRAYTWEDWIKHAKQFLKTIKEIYVKEVLNE